MSIHAPDDREPNRRGGWNETPGARGMIDDQLEAEAAEQLGLPHAVAADPQLRLAEALRRG